VVHDSCDLAGPRPGEGQIIAISGIGVIHAILDASMSVLSLFERWGERMCVRVGVSVNVNENVDEWIVWGRFFLADGAWLMRA
jgi:hypothetical protein